MLQGSLDAGEQNLHADAEQQERREPGEDAGARRTEQIDDALGVSITNADEQSDGEGGAADAGVEGQ